MNLVVEKQINEMEVVQALLQILGSRVPEITLKNDEPVINGKTVDFTHPAE
jgi:hypothetical protein